MRKSAPLNVIVHYPTTEEGKRELARRVSSVQADFVTDTICRLNCPTSQKLDLLNAVIESAKKEKKERMQKAAELSDLADLPDQAMRCAGLRRRDPQPVQQRGVRQL